MTKTYFITAKNEGHEFYTQPCTENLKRARNRGIIMQERLKIALPQATITVDITDEKGEVIETINL